MYNFVNSIAHENNIYWMPEYGHYFYAWPTHDHKYYVVDDFGVLVQVAQNGHTDYAKYAAHVTTNPILKTLINNDIKAYYKKYWANKR
jgi:hypothetical protein